MMKVKQLIRELKKLPQNLEVEVAMHDNYEHESAGEVCGVIHFIKSEHDPIGLMDEDRMVFDVMNDECIILRC